MKYRSIGASGLKVSELSLGSYLTISEADSIELIYKAMDLGINSFDTANTYQNGEAERILGKALKSFPRDEYVISTKAFWPTGSGPNSRGLSRKHLTEQVSQSLRRMDLDYIDLFYCHSFDQHTPVEETLRTLDDLIRQGKILYAGVSNWSAEQLQEAMQISSKLLLNKLIVNQCEYSLLKRDIEVTQLPYTTELGISQITFSPLSQGILTGKYTHNIPDNSRATNPAVNKFFYKLFTEENLKLVEKLEVIAKEYGLTIIELSLSWVLRQDKIASTVIGASSIVQLEENVKAVEKMIPHHLISEINDLLLETE
ncbi:aldo/keto reductase [Bacillus sp. BGMRC 2118]|nr:aldo/keto reductase [Bacillus sp. BGMRC 2118]